MTKQRRIELCNSVLRQIDFDREAKAIVRASRMKAMRDRGRKLREVRGTLIASRFVHN